MTPDVERFLDLATRQLEAAPGEREEARGELMSRVSHGGVPYEMLDLSAPIGRLEQAGPAKHGLRRGILVAGALLLAAGVACAVAVLARDAVLMSQAGMLSFQMRYGGFGPVGEAPEFLLRDVRSRAPELPLGLHPQAGAAEETATALLKSPDDLPMWQEHVVRRIRQEGTKWTGLLQEESDAVGRLDPDNALWPLIQVAAHMEKIGGSPVRVGAGSLSGGGIVVTETEFQSALQRFSEAAAKPLYRDHSRALKRRQLDAFPPERSLADSVVTTGFAGLVSPPVAMFSNGLRSFAEARCERLVKAGDKEELAKFSGEWKQVVRLIARSGEPGELEYWGVLSQVLQMQPVITQSLVDLGLATEASGAESLHREITNVIHSGGSGSIPPELEGEAGARMESATAIPLGLTAEELRPSRRAELCFMDRVLATAFVVVALIVTGLVALECCRRSKGVKAMARGLMPLFQKQDHLWIAGLGVAFPWLWWWVIARMSPIGMRDAKFEEWTALVWLLQPAAGLVFGMVMLLQTARWRWGVRAGFLGLGVPLPWIGWGVAAFTGLSIPAAGLVRYLDSLNDDETAAYLLGVAGMAACGILWLLWQGIMALFTPRSGALRPNLTMRAALPWAMAGTFSLLVAVAAASAMERIWFARDPLFPAGTSKTHLNAFEERAAVEARERLRGL